MFLLKLLFFWPNVGVPSATGGFRPKTRIQIRFPQKHGRPRTCRRGLRPRRRRRRVRLLCCRADKRVSWITCMCVDKCKNRSGVRRLHARQPMGAQPESSLCSPGLEEETSVPPLFLPSCHFLLLCCRLMCLTAASVRPFPPGAEPDSPTRRRVGRRRALR